MSSTFLAGSRTHVITGAASGIGRAVAQKLAARGDRLILLVRSDDRIDEVARAIPSHERILVADLADTAALAELAPQLLSGRPDTDRIDSLIHVAGVVDLSSVEALDVDQWQQHLAVNLTAPAILTKAMLSRLRAGRGTVVFVNSSAGLSASAQWSAYAASKFGLRAFADALRAEEIEHGVRVTTVFPSRTATPMQEKVHEQEGRHYDPARWISPETVADTILHVLDLPSGATIPEVTVRPVVPRPS